MSGEKEEDDFKLPVKKMTTDVKGASITTLTPADLHLINTGRRTHKNCMRELIAEFGTAEEKKQEEITSRRPLLTPRQDNKSEETMKIKSMRALLSRLEVSLHHKEKLAVIDMISKLSDSMNVHDDDKKIESSQQLKDLLQSNEVQKHHLEHQALDEQHLEKSIYDKEKALEVKLNKLRDEKEAKIDSHKVAIYADEETKKSVATRLQQMSIDIDKLQVRFNELERARHAQHHSVCQKRNKIEQLRKENIALREHILIVEQQEKERAAFHEEKERKVCYLKRRKLKLEHKHTHNMIKAKLASDRRQIEAKGRIERHADMKESYEEKIRLVQMNKELQSFNGPEIIRKRKRKVYAQLKKHNKSLSAYLQTPLELSPRPYTLNSKIEDRSILMKGYPLTVDSITGGKKELKRAAESDFSDTEFAVQRQRYTASNRYREKRKSNIATSRTKKVEFQVGAYVWCNCRGHGDWYSATVAARNVDGNFYEILYDDGVTDLGVPYTWIRRREKDDVDNKDGHEALVDKQSRLTVRDARETVGEELGHILYRARQHTAFGAGWRKEWDDRRKLELLVARKMGLLDNEEEATLKDLLGEKDLTETGKNKDFIMSFLDQNPNGQSPRFWIPPEAHKVSTVDNALKATESAPLDESSQDLARNESTSSLLERRDEEQMFTASLNHLKKKAIILKAGKPKQPMPPPSICIGGAKYFGKRCGRSLTIKDHGKPFLLPTKNSYGVVEFGMTPKSPKGHIFETKALPPTSPETMKDKTMPWVNTLKHFFPRPPSSSSSTLTSRRRLFTA
jgi:hypothetical protein